MNVDTNVVIIGGGPAGCQCALWLNMLGYKPIIIEKNNELGGLQLSSPYLNNWMAGTTNTTGQQFASKLQEHIQKENINVLFDSNINNIKQTKYGYEITVNNVNIKSNIIVIATGVKPKQDNFRYSNKVIIGPGKEIEQLSIKNKNIAIFGGGDNAAENYSFIKNKNPKTCHIYAKKIKARNNLWKNISSQDCFIGAFETDQDNMKVLHNGIVKQYDIFIVLYGWEPNIPVIFEPIKQILLDQNGFILTDNLRRTNVYNIYAIGEVIQSLFPCVITAMSDGVIAAKAIQHSLENKQLYL